MTSSIPEPYRKLVAFETDDGLGEGVHKQEHGLDMGAIILHGIWGLADCEGGTLLAIPTDPLTTPRDRSVGLHADAKHVFCAVGSKIRLAGVRVVFDYYKDRSHATR